MEAEGLTLWDLDRSKSHLKVLHVCMCQGFAQILYEDICPLLAQLAKCSPIVRTNPESKMKQDDHISITSAGIARPVSLC
jgi:hypothetical protein